jgi:hypothetical protein
MWRRVGRAGALLLGYASVVLALTWPLGTKITDHLPAPRWPCRFDVPAITWALAHQSRALTSASCRLSDAAIYHPTPRALFYGETGAGALPYFLPTFVVSGNPTLAINVTVLASIALTAWALHLVVARWTASFEGGVVAAWTYLMTPWVLSSFAPCAPSHAVVQYLPWIVFLAAGALASWAAAGLLLALVIVQSLSNPYIAAAVVAPLALLALVRCSRAATRIDGGRLLAVVAVTLLALVAAHAGQIMVRRENPDLAHQTPWIGVLAAPWNRARLPWNLRAPGHPAAVPAIALGVIVFGAASGLARRRNAAPRITTAPARAAPDGAATAWRHGLFWTVAGLLASMTPASTLFGWPLPLPHVALADWLGVYDAIRVPKRLAVASLIGLCILAGTAFAECARRLGARAPGWPARAGRMSLLLAVMACAYASYPRAGLLRGGKPALTGNYPLFRPGRLDPELLDILRHGAGPFLELPISLGQQSSRVLAAAAMYRSISHQRPIINGYHGYWPAAYPARVALAARLPDTAALAALVRETGVALILVHRLPQPPARWARWLTLADRGGGAGLRFVTRVGESLLFAVETAAPEGDAETGKRVG